MRQRAILRGRGDAGDSGQHFFRYHGDDILDLAAAFRLLRDLDIAQRIEQRIGRIDRIGSPNERIQLVNFWPNIELEEYINLEQRVRVGSQPQPGARAWELDDQRPTESPGSRVRPR